MKHSQPLHVRHQNVDGPIDAYSAAEPWTRELQQEMAEAFERDQETTGLASPLIAFVRYRCPKCERRQEEIRFESVVFYADEDFHHLRPLGEGQLITMADCGHQYRREIAA
ncbi:hypothetical protein ACKI1J_14865 [Streptomyces scabiei]|uniref:hypothetical protein n=1 Tax=Streptomyces scabiei TaxID=1930 RepID=UPI0017A5F5E4|nr:hypothetical protein [Streptomyces sp.]